VTARAETRDGPLNRAVIEEFEQIHHVGGERLSKDISRRRPDA